MDQCRPRQMPGNICPTCSVAHFPFCPAPPMFHQNPRFPFDGDPSYQRLPFNSFGAVGPMGTPTPFLDNRNDGFRAHNMWQRDNYWDHRDSFGQSPFRHQSNFSSNAYVGEADRNLKRPRVDDVPSSFASFDQSSAGISADHERRLKLIRDHGGAATATPEDKRGQLSRNQNGFQQPRCDQTGISSQPYQAPAANALFQPQHMSQHVNSSDNCYSNNQQFQGKDYMYANGHSYPPTNQWQGVNAPHHEHRVDDVPNSQPSLHHGMHYPVHPRHDLYPAGRSSEGGALDKSFHSQGGAYHQPGCHGRTYLSGGPPQHPHPIGGGSFPGNVDRIEASHANGQPPLPATPPPPLPAEPPCELKTYFSPPKVPASLFPVPSSSSATVHSPYTPAPDSLSNPYLRQKPLPSPSASCSFAMEEPSQHFSGDAQSLALRQPACDKAKVVDALHLFKQPHRANRPDHIVVILRGFPGSGKSYLAKMLRDLEVENGGNAPRIHSMDDYFMTEVEKTVDESEVPKSSNSARPKKLVKKKVMEYCYEPEMEEAYRTSMLKAFKKTVEEGSFTFIIVDDRNLRVADFAQFWATAKRSGYEVYILEAAYKDPAGCAARNVHNFTLEDIEKMTKQWEEAPSLYMQLDVKSLFHGDDLKENRIQEVDMDMEDEYGGDELPGTQETALEKDIQSPVQNSARDGSLNGGKEWDEEGDHPARQLRELGKSKWSEDFDDDVHENTETVKGNINALSGLICAYGKEGKSVRWGDQVANTGFSIGAVRTSLSLVIGPGAGYNLKSNPLPKDEKLMASNTSESTRHNVFQEQIRAERESFRLVFDKRRHRIGGLDVDD